ncbi:hypothetical protein G7Y89_g1895 [Cudoniella acicularis]|uniref:Zn(2)-C6 fungal-type domain-containing protein n=1 Tax=Cudoniella acicularis TaxID=354080 RepID=A0A8H4RV76_9HELO|nr:hypothetical protein G7Y89_g1895 [Cudoniella acicularis]
MERDKNKIYRVCGTPSRTGCVTCKGRPKCKRCIKARRTCEWCPPPSTHEQPRSLLAPSYAPSPLPAVGHDERQVLFFFANFSAPGLSGHFSSDFWQRRILQVSLAEPCIRHAVIAIGALHQHFNASQLVPTSQHHSSLQFALRQHTKAISHLQQILVTQADRPELALMACILFVCFDSLFGNYQSALIHLRSGLNILQDIQTSGSSLPNDQREEFASLLMRLGCQACLFLNPRSDNYRSALWQELRTTIPDRPLARFDSIEDAHQALSSIGTEYICDRDPARPVPILQSVLKQKHFILLVEWEQSLKEFLARSDKSKPSIERIVRGASLLKAFHLMVIIAVDNSRACDKLFSDIITLCEIVDTGQLTYAAPPEIFNFSTSLGITAPLFYTAMKCDNLALRRKAWKLLQRAPRKEGMWDAELCARIVGKVLQILEPSGEQITPENCGLRRELQLRRKLKMDGFHPESLVEVL